MKSLITYFGGKGGMYSKIIQHFPTNFDTYIEPFGGSYAIGFQATEKLRNKIEFYNDLEKNVYSIFKVLSDVSLFETFKYKLDLTPYDENVRAEFIKDLKGELDVIDRAYKYFYVIRTSFNGVGGFSHAAINRRGMSKSVSAYLKTVDCLYEYHDRVSKICVLQTNGIELIEKYNTNNFFIYCDPPYAQSTRTATRYLQDMDDKIQIDFLNACLKSNAKILISGYDNPLYDILDSKFEKIQFQVDTVSGTMIKKTKTETLWKNY
jgi:DNA adenine methylase